MSVAVISAEHLTKRFGATTAVDRLDLEVAPGELVALLGPNGAGKTTTVELLLGLHRPDGGRAAVLGLDPAANGRLHTMVGAMLQDGAVPSGLRAREAVRLHAAFHADPADPDELLERLGLTPAANRTFRHLSGGQKRRLMLALALVGRPEVLFLDEPTAGLDPAARATTWALVRELAADGATVLLTTQLIEEAERVADRVAIIDRGRLLAEGPPGELVKTASERLVGFRARAGLDVSALGTALGAKVEAGPDGYRVLAEPTPALVAGLTGWLADHGELLTELHVGGGTLEQVFLELTGEAGKDAGKDAGKAAVS
jgi:ABC-2 type transport system ATP-binding protein